MTELERIFDEALELPADKRLSFVLRECGEDRELASQVNSLLAHHLDLTGDLQATAGEAASELLAETDLPRDLEPGAVVGCFRIERKLGQGGMGAVYLATDLQLGREVAIKVLRCSFGDKPDAVDRFRKEARSTAGLAHVNIATLYGGGETDDGLPYFAMELVSGWTLRSRLESGPLSEALALQYAEQLAAALEHAHSRRVIHCDIKPENILVSGDGALKVVDFGIASLLDASERVRAVDGDERRRATGTLAYAAPEILSGERPSARSDVYSFGVVLYEMLCGSNPFPERSGTDKAAVITAGSYMPLRERVPGLSAELAALAERCMARDATERYSDGARVRAAIRTIEQQNKNAAASQPGRGSLALPALAVLDFANRSGDAGLDWLSGGLAESLTAELTNLDAIRVINRTRLRQTEDELQQRHGQTAVDPATIAQALNARWAVSGSYQRSGTRLRVTPSLIEAHSGDVIAAEVIDANWDDLFAIQDRAAAALTKAILKQLGTSGDAAESSRKRPGRPTNLTAFEHFSRGRQLMSRMGPQSIAEATRHFERAIGVDPEYAQAHSGLGSCYALHFVRSGSTDDLDRASTALERAVELDPDLGEPYPWLCNIRERLGDSEGADQAALRGIELQPDLYEAHYFFGGRQYLFSETGNRDLQAGIDALVQSIRLQPRFHPAWVMLGATAAFVGQHETAIAILSEAQRIEKRPGLMFPFVGAAALRATALFRSGDWARSRSVFEESLHILKDAPEHIYRSCFLILSECGLGDIALRTGLAEQALAHFSEASRLAALQSRMTGIERLMLRASTGMSAAYSALGDPDCGWRLYEHAAAQIADVSKPRMATIECGLAQLHLNLAVAAVRAGRFEEAAGHLAGAREKRWKDLKWLLTDPELAPMHTHMAYLSFVADLRAYPPVLLGDDLLGGRA